MPSHNTTLSPHSPIFLQRLVASSLPYAAAALYIICAHMLRAQRTALMALIAYFHAVSSALKWGTFYNAVNFVYLTPSRVFAVVLYLYKKYCTPHYSTITAHLDACPLLDECTFGWLRRIKQNVDGAKSIGCSITRLQLQLQCTKI